MCYFPQIIQGPISFYDQLAHQLYEPHDFEFTRFKHGTELVLWGLFKKLVIADRAYIAINTVLDDYYGYSGTVLTFTIILYALQLYTDFSGGIDVVLGVSDMMGIRLSENFNTPYFSQSVQEFWRRWHMTLGGWLRNYVYIPLGGSRKGIVRKYLNTIITFLVSGIWHGAE